MDRVLTYKIIENGYDIYASVNGGELIRTLHQPEPFIICRVKNEDGTTNYAESAEAHIALIKQADAEAEKRAEDEKTQAEKIVALEASVASIENSIDEIFKILDNEPQ